MNTPMVVEIVRQAFTQCFWVCLPLSERRIRGRGVDQPTADRDFHSGLGVWYGTRLAAFLLALFVFLPWMLYRLTEYADVDFGPPRTVCTMKTQSWDSILELLT
jgi:hypothetical protein